MNQVCVYCACIGMTDICSILYLLSTSASIMYVFVHMCMW